MRCDSKTRHGSLERSVFLLTQCIENAEMVVYIFILSSVLLFHHNRLNVLSDLCALSEVITPEELIRKNVQARTALEIQLLLKGRAAATPPSYNKSCRIFGKLRGVKGLRETLVANYVQMR
ncbi:hypothetical protein E2C01_042285 [Portunus trituberculatus]|uniref:Uncharacterized protein n=1 Tax=Portunus trituberculatus TaxID=210409 RepID=A0A5B7FM22_PORTR|nr:hypothetical protein [Portunus trituberculatus]